MGGADQPACRALRMDEDHANLTVTEFNLSEVASDTVSEFAVLAAENINAQAAVIEPSVWYRGDEGWSAGCCASFWITPSNTRFGRRDPSERLGKRAVSGHHRREFVPECGKEELNRFFDRFYRADKARTFNGGFGVGLSIAKGLQERHKGRYRCLSKGFGTDRGLKLR